MKITKFKMLLLDISLSICSFNPLCVWGVGNDPVVGWSSLKMIWGHPISKNHPLVHREWIIRSIIIHDGHSLWVVQWEYQNLNLAIALSNLEDFNQIGKSGHVHRIKLTTSSAKPARVTGSVVQTSFCCLTRDDGPADYICSGSEKLGIDPEIVEKMIRNIWIVSGSGFFLNFRQSPWWSD